MLARNELLLWLLESQNLSRANGRLSSKHTLLYSSQTLVAGDLQSFMQNVIWDGSGTQAPGSLQQTQAEGRKYVLLRE